MHSHTQVKELQEAHAVEAEAAAERMRLPSPSSIRAKFRHGQGQLLSPSGSSGGVAHQQGSDAEGAPAAPSAGAEEQLAPWSQD